MPTSSFTNTCASFLGVFAGLSTATYVLQEDFGNTAAFFDKFTFYTEPDPTHGFVEYVDQATAEESGLININDDSIYMGVDYTNVVADGGRQSVRLTSKDVYNHGLVIIDLTHMPGNVCGAWPAFWMVGPDWPAGGEIDIIEGVSLLENNAVALHTTTDCSINDMGFTGDLQTSNCYISAPDQGNNAGCGIKIPSTASYGDGFNDAGGGVYATEWTATGFKTWLFGHESVPTDISDGQPDPSSWPTPDAAFAGDCDFERHFWDMQIVFDTTFCGDWAGNENVWAESGNCATLAPTCPEYVGDNPAAFENAYWEIVSLKVYQESSTTEEGGEDLASRRQFGRRGVL
ncbi:concanavalin A-like lectin/glucanase domain-containing protein [Aspergillus cavernicola]|uniref:Concanavalin A-like lectin/glucanase domain-containing protein n=1 Tax=Aspergillus cavernicola TaxID=176166 RepID=A0ABR4HFU9_9EURO